MANPGTVHTISVDLAIETVAVTIQRRAKLARSRTEGQLYLDVDGATHSTTIEERRLA